MKDLNTDYVKRTQNDSTQSHGTVFELAQKIWYTKEPHYSCYMKTPEQMRLQRDIKNQNI